MSRFLTICALFLALPTTAHADRVVSSLSQRRVLLKTHRVRLERLLNAQVARIGRLKGQPSGVRRDIQLRTALRENRQLATKLTQLQDQMRELNRRLLSAYDGAIARAADGATSARLRQRRDALARELSARRSTQIVTKGKAELLDSPEDLEEKADLLKDSEAKLRRQLARIGRQIAKLKRRSKLRRHSRAAEDSLFVEDSPRRMARARARSSSPAEDTTQGARAPQAPKAQDPTAPPPAGGGTMPPTSSYNGATGKTNELDASAAPSPPLSSGVGPARAGAGSSELSLDIRGVLDPSILRELRQASKSGSVKQRLAALAKAQRRIQQMADKLAQRSQSLRTRAKSRRQRR